MWRGKKRGERGTDGLSLGKHSANRGHWDAQDRPFILANSFLQISFQHPIQKRHKLELFGKIHEMYAVICHLDVMLEVLYLFQKHNWPDSLFPLAY
jgi:hypothetical protein